MRFTILWPDGRPESCYSPSLVVKEHLTPGESYPLEDFVGRTREALTIASERVRAKYGFACSSAAGQLARIEAEAARYRSEPGARVEILSFEE